MLYRLRTDRHAIYHFRSPGHCWVRGRVSERWRTAFGYEVTIDYDGVVAMDGFVHVGCLFPRPGGRGYENWRGRTDRIPLTSHDIDFNDHRVYADESDLSRVEGDLSAKVWRECDGRQDRFERRLKSRRKGGKGKRKQERSNAAELRSRRRIKRKGKKYVNAITHKVYLS